MFNPLPGEVRRLKAEQFRGVKTKWLRSSLVLFTVSRRFLNYPFHCQNDSVGLTNIFKFIKNV